MRGRSYGPLIPHRATGRTADAAMDLALLFPERGCRQNEPPAGDRPAPGWGGGAVADRGSVGGARGELPSRPPPTQAEPSRRGPWRPGRSYSGALHLDAMDHARSTVCGSTADGMGAGEGGGQGGVLLTDRHLTVTKPRVPQNVSMDAGLAAVLGAAVGACGSAVAAGVSGFFSRTQTMLQLVAQQQQTERQIRADLATQLREPRRQAYANYAAEATARLDALWWVGDALSQSPPLREAAEERLRASFSPSSSTAYERVLLEGPEEVAVTAADLAAAIEDATHIALTWIMDLEAGAEPIRRDFGAELSRATDTAKQCRRSFRMAAMEAVRADGSEPRHYPAPSSDHLSSPHSND